MSLKLEDVRIEEGLYYEGTTHERSRPATIEDLLEVLAQAKADHEHVHSEMIHYRCDTCGHRWSKLSRTSYDF